MFLTRTFGNALQALSLYFLAGFIYFRHARHANSVWDSYKNNCYRHESTYFCLLLASLDNAAMRGTGIADDRPLSLQAEGRTQRLQKRSGDVTKQCTCVRIRAGLLGIYSLDYTATLRYSLPMREGNVVCTKDKIICKTRLST